MIQKICNLNLDMFSKYTTHTDYVLVQGDIGANVFVINLQYQKNPMDLTETTTTITFLKPDGNKVVGSPVTTNVTQGVLTYNVGEQEVSYAGKVFATVEVYDNTGKRLTSGVFAFEVREQLNDGTAIESTTDYPFLAHLMSAGAEELSRVNAESTRVTSESARVTSENTRNSSEATRVSQENTRKTNETARGTAETARATAESTRVTQENARKTAETSRVSVEASRVTAETGRNNAEATRVSQESSRVTAETSRGTAESTRVTQENTRNSNESARGTAESARSTAETARQTAETTRGSQESTRQSNEATRVTSEATRVSQEGTRTTQETARVNAEGDSTKGRVKAENLRVTAESGRVSAESTRTTQESTRGANETARQSAETTRVNQEVARVNSEGDATKGRIKAENDRVSAETVRASSENTRVSQESGRVSAESTRATQETARVNAEGDSTKGRVKAENDRASAESSRVTAESTRVTQENTRKTNETARQSAETTRTTQETSRVNAEGNISSGRVKAENDRASAESTRATSESTRVSNEATRVSSENTRVTQETARVSAEGNASSGRVKSENDRKTAESARVTAESGRVTAENTRVSNESTRGTNETARVSAESSRATAETARVTADSARTTSENARKTAETGRVNAESSRVTAESSRVSAESTRVSSETTRGSNETARQSAETTRQSQESTRQTNTTSAIGRLDDAVESTVLVWKPAVATFANIATAYPSPSLGWRVETNDTKRVYRYDGSTWLHVSDGGLGYEAENVAKKGVANGYAPLDVNSKVPVENLPPLSEIPLVIGTQTVTTASWTGSSDVESLYNGLTIRYWLPRTSSSNVTLNLTLKNGSTTGAIPCYYGGTTRLTTHYSAGSFIMMIYLENALINGVAYTGWWAKANYADGTESYTVRWNASLKAGAEITQYKLLTQGANGSYYPTTIGNTTAGTKAISTTPFLIGSPILFYLYTPTVAVGGLTTSAYVYTGLTTSTTTYAWNQNSGWRASEDVYLKGTVSGALFTLDNTTLTSHMTQDLPTTEDGFFYMRLGMFTNTTTGFRLSLQHPVYYFANGELQSLNTSNGSDWEDVVNKPATFPATAHTHPTGEVTGLGNIATINKNANTSNYLRGDGTWATPPNTVYTHPTADGSLHVPATSTTNNGKVLKAGSTAGSLLWGTDNDTITTVNGKTGAIAKADIVALGIPAQDTVYTHPATHPPAIIAQDSSNRFVSDTEKTTWNGKANSSHTHTIANVTNLQTELDGKAGINGKASGSWQIGEKIYNVANCLFTSTPTEILIKTGIPFVSSSHMPVIHIEGYAYGLQSPVELKIGYYVYGGAHGWCGAVSMGAWQPTIKLFTYLVGATKYTGIALIGSIYYPQFSVHVQTEFGGNYKDGWSITSNSANNTIYHMPDTDVVTVPYKSTFSSKINGVTYNGTSDITITASANGGNSDTVDGKHASDFALASQVLTNVPAGALFTDTVYSHPASHSPSIIAQDASNRFTTDTEKATWNAKASTAVATTSVNGLMSSTDKTKLNGVATSANNYAHPSGDGNLHVPATSTINNGKVLKAGATAGSLVWGTDNDTVTTVNGKTGAIAKADIVALGIPAQDTVYSHPANHPASIITQDASNRFVTDTEKATWSNKASKATTLLGYGIADGATYSELNALQTHVEESYVGKSGLINLIYPVGSIYLSANNVSPATFIGGTWSKLEGRFLLGADTTYTAGGTGGTATETLTTSQTPVHNHTIDHTHADTSVGTANLAHTHTVSGTSAINSVGHTHGVSGTTAFNNVGHTHGIPALSGTASSAGAHAHSTRYKGFALTASTGGWMVLRRNETGDSYDGTDSDGAISAGAHTHSVTTTASTTDGNSVNHTHTFSATSGGISANHTHTFSATSGAMSANGTHTHSVSTPSHSGNSGNAGSGLAHNNMPPYLSVHMWQRTA